MNEMEEAIRQLKQAIFVEGVVPYYHREIMKKHRKEWPTLWAAIDKLIEVENDE